MTNGRGARAQGRRGASRQGGFTLVELLVVVVILGILAAVVVVAVRGASDKGKGAAVAADERTIRTAQEAYCARAGRYATDMGQLTGDLPVSADDPSKYKFLSGPSEYHALKAPPPGGSCNGTGYEIICKDGTPMPNCGAPVPGGPQPQQSIVAVSAGNSHSLRLTSDGKVFASGSGGQGALGDGTYTDRQTPVQVKGEGGVGFLEGVKAVAAGTHVSLALKNDGTVWAWGSNSFGQLGNGSPVSGLGNRSPTPVQVKGGASGDFLTGVTAISTGTLYVMALKGDGTVWAWGQNIRGQLGDGTSGFDRTTPVQVKGENGSGFLIGVTAIGAGEVNSLAVKDGAVWAWGDNQSGQLGDGTTTNRLTPVPVRGSGGGPFGGVAVASGNGYSLARKADNTVWVWGAGPGGGVTTMEPVKVDLEGVTAVVSGRNHVLASKNDGTVWAWGDGAGGLLGNDTTTPSATPAPVKGYRGVGGLVGATALSAGSGHSMAVMGDGRVLFWGSNSFGQFGTGDWESSLVPTDKDDPKPPANDAFAARRVLATCCTGSIRYGGDTGTNMFASMETGEPSHKPGNALAGNKSVWYEWTPPAALLGKEVRFTTSGSNFNTTMGIYTTNDPLNPNPNPSVSSLTPVDQNDNYQENEWSRVVVRVVPGAVYFIAVDGSTSADQGGIMLEWGPASVT